MGIFILYTRRKSKARRFFFKFSGNLQVGGISILLLRGGCVKSKNQVFFDILYKKDFISLLC